jgi:DinB superfamily
MAVGQDLATDYQETIAEVIAFAETCSDDDWQTRCPNEERTVGVLFDHVAAGNEQAMGWIQSFLAGQPVRITREELHASNAEHALKAAGRPRPETIADLRASSARTAELIGGLSQDRLDVTQEFGWAGTQDLAWVVAAAIRHPRIHFQSVRDALGR